MLRTFWLSLFFLLQLPVVAQEDSVRLLEEVIVNAYSHDRPLTEVPASVGVVDEQLLSRFNFTSFLPALNTIPAVKMEERSPGSYRLSIRGSTLRSPFGVRNVKIYWNGVPFTDPGGNTYLNLLDFSAIQRVEVIKGPGSSLYGAGTGGVLLLQSKNKKEKIMEAEFTGGTYGLLRYRLAGNFSTKGLDLHVNMAHQASSGYRDHTRMARDGLRLNGDIALGTKSTLSFNFLYSDLFYQTPGGLNLAQFKSDPTQARPPTMTQPGAVEQNASVSNKTYLLGLGFETEWNDQWLSRITVLGTTTDFENPAIRNYEIRDERSLSVRNENQYKFGIGKIVFGGEWQYGTSDITVGTNNLGVFGTTTSEQTIRSNPWFVFSQTELEIGKDFLLTLGASLNNLNIRFSDLTLAGDEKIDYHFIFSPRIALLKKFSSAWSVYAQVSRGYSQPTVAEILPSNGILNPDLQPEAGNNYEGGIKVKLDFLEVALTPYDFELKETIVLRRDTAGADYFVNAGKTSQQGIELSASWNPFPGNRNFKWWTAYSLNHYRFKDYFQDTNDFSGNLVTGTAPQVIVTGIDYAPSAGFYGNVAFTYSDHIPLDDGNTAYGHEYFLLSAKAGYSIKMGEKFVCNLFIGADNLLDQNYSLGHDLNAAVGRYYNAAPGRNFIMGLVISASP